MHFIPLSEHYVPTAADPANDGSASPAFSGSWHLLGHYQGHLDRSGIRLGITLGESSA